MKVLESIDKFAETSRVAVRCLDKQLTYEQLKKYSDKVAMYLLKEFKRWNIYILLQNHVTFLHTLPYLILWL